MKKEKKEKNENIIIALLVLIIIILLALVSLLVTGTVSYKAKPINNEEEKPQINEVKNDDLITKIVGTYSYKGKYVDNEKEIGENFKIEETIYDEVVLSSTGEAEAKAGSIRGGGYTAKGKWYISKDEIIIINENCQATIINDEVEYPNCSPTWIYKYKIENDTITLTSINNTMKNMELNKK